MGGYIRIDKELPTDGRLLQIADQIAEKWTLLEGGQPLHPLVTRHALRHAVTGVIVTLWAYADTHIRRDNSLPVTLSGVTQIVNVPVTLLQLLPEEWLRVRPDGLVELPGYCEKNGIRAKDLRKEDRAEHQRELARIRKQRQRSKATETVTRDTPRDTPRDSHDFVTHTGTGPLPNTSEIKTPLPPHSGGPVADATGPRRASGTNPRATGESPRQKAEQASQDALMAALIERARQCGFREPTAFDTPATYETSLRLHERGCGPVQQGAPRFA